MSETVDYDAMRHKINDAILESVEEEETEDTLVFGWVLIFEGVHADNKRSLTFITSDGSGDKSLPPWASKGYMHHYMDGIYTVDDELLDEEEDEEDDD
jgi:hypothetical protein